ncbi:MAG: dTDP-4-dehydrorhamnose reductase [Bdellovibrionales bacterium]|nr:dTDP-4-dehydrorhamnose reductase [Bdellovibrionales bacterium]
MGHLDPKGGAVWVLGAAGQIGTRWIQLLKARGISVLAPTRAQLDLTDLDSLRTYLLAHSSKPIQAIVNAAAYTQVDLAEKERNIAQVLNAELPGTLAKLAHQHNVPLVHYSTDYVFSGTGTKPWVETDPTGPLNFYGETKLAGEKAILATGARALILRTSWIFDGHGRNFLRTMTKLGRHAQAKPGQKIRVVNDQIGAPSFAKDVAAASLRALEEFRGSAPEIFHLCHAGACSWFEFAAEIFRQTQLQVDLEAIPSSQYPTPAKRPLNSRLDCGKLKATFGIEMPDWKKGLEECIRENPDL